MESEANLFASQLLMPPAKLKKAIGRLGVSLISLIDMARDFDLSKERVARAFVHSHREPAAIIVSRYGRAQRFYRHEDFPYLPIRNGKALPPEAIASDALAPGSIFEIEDVEPDIWLTERGVDRLLALSEQALGQSSGYALTLLQAELDDEA